MLASLAALVLTPFWPTHTLADFAQNLQDQIHLGERRQLEPFFDKPDRDLTYLLAMGQRSGGLKTIKVVILPAAPGWESWGRIWAVLHTFQDCEQDHDMVMEVLPSPSGYKLGREIPQSENGGAKVNSVAYSANLDTTKGIVNVETILDVTKSPVGWSPVFRLNDIYKIQDINGGKHIVSADSGVIQPAPDTDFVRAGGVLIPWKPIDTTQNLTFDKPPTKTGGAKVTGQLHLKYTGDITHARAERTDDQDILSPKEACIASLWIPSLGQLPTPVFGEIKGPEAWVLRGEGNEVSHEVIPDGSNESAFYCPLPISFPKIIGGLYQVAAETKIGDQTFRVLQLDLDKPAAETALKRMTEAATFYQANLAPLPFPGYELYISEHYYGIESYSHTILQAKDAFEVSHELGHTYFGGMAPCPYVHDTWNEGVTQYIDSIALHHDEDRSLEAGIETVTVKVPLNAIPVPWSYDNASYTRGAYVMRMLEDEITPQGVMAGLKALVADRVGKDTRWDDLRPYFEKVSGKDLSWFWSQWIDSADFPQLTITDQTTVQREKKYRTLVTIRQSGTKKPYQMRLTLVGTVDGRRVEAPVEAKDAETIAWIDSDIKPTEVHLEVFPKTLAIVRSKS